MQVQTDFPLNKIVFDEKNPNKTSKSQEAASMKFMQEHDILRTVLLDQNFLCIDGEHIAKRAIEAGHTTINVIIKEFKDDAERAAVRSFLNYGPRGKPDEELFAAQLKEIYDSGKLGTFAQTMNRAEDEFAQELEEAYDIPRPGSEVPDQPKPRSKPGQIWQCGNHMVMCGDATEIDDICTLLSWGKDNTYPRLILTDPPYDFDKFNWLDPFFQTENKQDLEILVLNSDKPTVKMLANYAKWFIGFYVITFNSPAKYSNQPMISHRLISHYRIGKSNFQNLHDAFGTVHELALSKSGLTRHEKPLDLPRKLIVHYTKPQQIVLDLFAGSGSTMISCEQLGRVCYSMEKDPLKVDIILKRYEDYTHDKAVKV
jgi:DNA modification methylase